MWVCTVADVSRLLASSSWMLHGMVLPVQHTVIGYCLQGGEGGEQNSETGLLNHAGGVGLPVSGFMLRVSGFSRFRFRIQDSGFRFQGAGCSLLDTGADKGEFDSVAAAVLPDSLLSQMLCPLCRVRIRGWLIGVLLLLFCLRCSGGSRVFAMSCFSQVQG